MSEGNIAQAPAPQAIPAEVERQYAHLVETIRGYNPGADFAQIDAAYRYAAAHHGTQKRKDGSPFITHPIAVAQIVAEELHLDSESIIASLLHDCIEDTDATYDDVAKRFSPTVADLVEGVSKLTRVHYTSKEEEQMENLRKMLMAMAKDIRVILIKISDRLHNMRTREYQSTDKQRQKSLETMEIYAPIAHRLGMQKAKWELEDLALMYLDPTGYNEIMQTLQERMPTLEAFMNDVEGKIKSRLEEDGMHASVYSRIKHIYSIYRKMYSQKLDINGIFDLCAFRVIVDTIPDCYNVLGIIHDMFKPVPGRFKDYISTPKPNMYQSVHTTVIGSQGIPFEVQIRTWEMHRTAEYGIAAHWKYKIGDSGVKTGDEEKFAWVRRLLESQQESDATDFFHNLKIDMFADEVFVFSPKGDVINLPAGATPIDFAYSIHSAVGNSMVGASVNGRIVTFDHVLQNGDIVEVRTAKNAPGPSRDWLNIAKSGSARTKIKQWFKKERREENIARGKEMFESELRNKGLRMEDITGEDILPQLLKKVSYTSLDEMYAAIGYGGMAATRAVNRIKDELARQQHAVDKRTVLDKVTEAAERREQMAKKTMKPVHGVLVEGLDNCLIKFSRCCTPVPGDDIIGYITRGQGVSIHRTDCENARRRAERPEDEGRWLNVSWADEIRESYTTTLTVVSRERGGLVMDIATVMNALNTKVRSINARDTGDKSIVVITLETKGLDELKTVINRLQGISGVVEVNRNGGKR